MPSCRQGLFQDWVRLPGLDVTAVSGLRSCRLLGLKGWAVCWRTFGSAAPVVAALCGMALLPHRTHSGEVLASMRTPLEAFLHGQAAGEKMNKGMDGDGAGAQEA